MQNLDLNPTAATAENPTQTTTSLTVALPDPTGQAPPPGVEQVHEHDQDQEKGQMQEGGQKGTPAKPDAIVLSSVLGTIDVLSEAEQAEYFACEEVVGSGWQSFVQVGLALGRIRDARLYREEFDSFDAYCRAKWQYARVYAYHLICAAQLFTLLLANCKLRKPEHESQLRPLIGLTLEQAQAAWERAAEKAGSRKITAGMVKSAVNELQLGGKAPPVAKKAGPTKAERRRLINDTFGQLLVLLSQKADHSLLREKIVALHGHVQAALAKPPSKA